MIKLNCLEEFFRLVENFYPSSHELTTSRILAIKEYNELNEKLSESRRLLQLADDANTMALQDSQIGAWSLSGELEKQITKCLHVEEK